MNANDLIMLRKQCGWNQTEAAKNLGCSVRSIQNWESGINKIPNSIALAAASAVNKTEPYGSK